MSCVESYKEGPFQYNSKVIEKYHEDEHEEYGMHYGYYMGEHKMHNGWYTEDEENVVKFEFFGEVLSRDSKNLYQNVGDTLYLYYERVYRVKKGDTTFIKNRIIEVNTK
jgi:hypothetical protein